MGLAIIQMENHEVIRFACAELESAAKRAGLSHGIVRETSRHGHGQKFYVGTWEAVGQAGLLPLLEKNGGGHDRFIIDEVDGDVVLAGENERATLFAVYEYSKCRWGEHWIYPNEMSVAAAQQSQPIKLEAGSPFARRGFVFETINEPEYIASMVDWMAKNRCNEIFFTFMLWDLLKDTIGPEITKRGMEVTLGGHSMKFFLRTESDADPLKAKDPYFSKRQLDYDDIGWQETVCQEIAEYCQNVPNLTRISLWPEDIAVGAEQEGNRFMKQYIDFSERLKTIVKRSGLDVEVEHISYNAGLDWNMLERQQTETSGEIDTLFAYWGRDYRYPFDSTMNGHGQRAFAALKDWREQTMAKGTKLTVFEYYSDQFMLTPLFPLLSSRIEEDLLMYERLGVDGMLNLVVPVRTIKDHPWHWIHQFNSYVFSRLCWKEPLHKVLADYLLYYEEKDRSWVQETFAEIERLLPALTAWNTSLFPARVVDPDQAERGTEEKADILSWLQEVSESMAQHHTQSPLAENHPARYYVRHLAEYAKKLHAEWEKN